MSEPTEFLAAIEAVVHALRRSGLRYYISGSVASSMYGDYRATNDIDIVVALTETALASLIDELSHAFVADLDQARDALATHTAFNLIHRASYLKVDVFPLTTPFDEMVAGRAQPLTMPGASGPLMVATSEDILLAKLRWYRLGDEQSEVQRRDIRGLIALNRDTLDRAHLATWAAKLGVDDLLGQFLRA